MTNIEFDKATRRFRVDGLEGLPREDIERFNRMYKDLERRCFEDMEAETSAALSGFNWDFLTGSVHWIDSWGFDHKETKGEWAILDVDVVSRRYYEIIKECDAILVLNLEKNKIKNYIGGNTFLEMGFAHVLNKKIYLQFVTRYPNS